LCGSRSARWCSSCWLLFPGPWLARISLRAAFQTADLKDAPWYHRRQQRKRADRTA
jgi:hypothetical protein